MAGSEARSKRSIETPRSAAWTMAGSSLLSILLGGPMIWWLGGCDLGRHGQWITSMGEFFFLFFGTWEFGAGVIWNSLLSDTGPLAKDRWNSRKQQEFGCCGSTPLAWYNLFWNAKTSMEGYQLGGLHPPQQSLNSAPKVTLRLGRSKCEGMVGSHGVWVLWIGSHVVSNLQKWTLRNCLKCFVVEVPVKRSSRLKVWTVSFQGRNL